MKTNISELYDDGHFYVLIEINNIEYEFLVDGLIATYQSKAKNLEYLADAANILKENYSYIYKLNSINNEIYQEFEKPTIFKLPIKIIQPSKFFLDKSIIKAIDEKIDENDVFFPVTIINDEYVLIDGHHKLYVLNQNYVKMVNVYIGNPTPLTQDFVYIAKEHNLNNIAKLDLLEHDQYVQYWEDFKNQFK